MGFPVSYNYTEAFLPTIVIYPLAFLGFVRSIIFSLFRFLGLPDFIESDDYFLDSPTRSPENQPLSAFLLREFLPVMKFEELARGKLSGAVGPPESCAVCLSEFEASEEIRWLANCKHIFHRGCLDRWMDLDRKTCPLCRTMIVPRHLQREFNRRLLGAHGYVDYDFYSDDPAASSL